MAELTLVFSNAHSEIVSPRQYHAARISEAWQKSVEAIVETGQRVRDAKEGPDQLPHGQFIAMVNADLPFTRSTAFRLMAIARDSVISNVAHGQHLPPSWRTLYPIDAAIDRDPGSLLRDPHQSRAEMAATLRPIGHSVRERPEC
jgi:hypothetical protein